MLVMLRPNLVVLSLSILLYSLPSFAKDQIPKLIVQNRAEVNTYEWTASAGMLPLDAFKKGVTASGGFTIHKDHTWAWEAVHFVYSFEYKTALEDQLRAFQQLEATPFERVETFVTSNVVYKPLYWKGAWLNQNMVYGELFFLAGGGYGWLSQSSRPVVDIGTGIKLFHFNGLESRFDVRWLNFFTQETAHSELWLGIGISL